jgi:ankyrin repeat protein
MCCTTPTDTAAMQRVPARQAPPVHKDAVSQAIYMIMDEEWDQVALLLARNSSLLATYAQVPFVYQGENSQAMLVHLLCSRKKTPLYLVQTLVHANPSCLLQPEKLGGRLPLHISIMKGASVDIVQYLCQAQPQALKEVDIDGNLPVHHAANYSSPALKFVIEAHPEACQVANRKDRFPLHLLCAATSSWGGDCLESETAVRDLQVCFKAYPKAIQLADRYGRLPLHLTCQAGAAHPSWDTLEFLIQEYSQALVTKDKSRHTPYALLKKCRASSASSAAMEDADVVLLSLAECTTRESKKHTRFPIFVVRPSCSSVVSRRRKQINGVDLYNCYG